MKIITYLLFLSVPLFCSMSAEAKIIKVIFGALFQKKELYVFVDSNEKYQIVKESGFTTVSTCSKADVIYATTATNECPTKPVFTDNYETFKENKNVFGAFYWSKGRPNIMFDSVRMLDFGLILPEQFKKYEMGTTK